ncbi:hypothetical protein [Rummeliibacillus sp. TYF-LIM-RU47]|uniref:hypothetical protein n=1 Tax=Rummeliibacillus sp. TYF-LIM-RU47 TaxID=2608406 RepID=UPI00123A745A|nr:hypothetical protein [Rummeliibacillus sp. TYF-LIM-RU47]
MIDLRDHGGPYGGGKYRKGSLLPLSDLGITKLLSEKFMSYEYYDSSYTVLNDYLYNKTLNRLYMLFYTSDKSKNAIISVPVNSDGVPKSSDVKYFFPSDATRLLLLDPYPTTTSANMFLVTHNRWYIMNRNIEQISYGTFSNSNTSVMYAVYNGRLIMMSYNYVYTVKLSDYTATNVYPNYTYPVAYSYPFDDGTIYIFEYPNSSELVLIKKFRLSSDGNSVTQEASNTISDSTNRSLLMYGSREVYPRKWGGYTYMASGNTLLKINDSNLSVVSTMQFSSAITDILLQGATLYVYTKETVNTSDYIIRRYTIDLWSFTTKESYVTLPSGKPQIIDNNSQLSISGSKQVIKSYSAVKIGG